MRGGPHAMWKQTPVVRLRRTDMATMLSAKNMVSVEDLSYGALPTGEVDDNVQGGKKFEQIGQDSWG